MGSIPVGSTKTTVKTVVFLHPTENRTAVNTARFPYARQARCYTGVPKRLNNSVVFIWWRERADDSGRIKKISTRAAFFSLSIILLLNVFWFLNQSMPDKNNTNRGQDVVFLTNTALHSRLRHKVLTRSRALSLPENTASDSRATKSSQNRTKIKKRSEKIDQ